MPRLTVGTRGSKLALTQTEFVVQRLKQAHPGIEVAIEIISTKGDRVLDRPLPEIGGKGLFTFELETALRDGAIDLAVHSLKDLPTDDAEGLSIGAILERATPNDAFISNRARTLKELPDGARIGTSSLRRKAQLRALNNSWELIDIRGNVETRLRKIDDGIVDAVILACAGLERIGRTDAITQVLPSELMLPACGQGALAVQVRAADKKILELLKPLHHKDTAAEVLAERSMLAALGGGCLTPIGALADAAAGALHMDGCVCSLDGAAILRTQVAGLADEAAALGKEAAEQLLELGADAIIAEIA